MSELRNMKVVFESFDVYYLYSLPCFIELFVLTFSWSFVVLLFYFSSTIIFVIHVLYIGLDLPILLKRAPLISL